MSVPLLLLRRRKQDRAPSNHRKYQKTLPLWRGHISFCSQAGLILTHRRQLLRQLRESWWRSSWNQLATRCSGIQGTIGHFPRRWLRRDGTQEKRLGKVVSSFWHGTPEISSTVCVIQTQRFASNSMWQMWWDVTSVIRLQKAVISILLFFSLALFTCLLWWSEPHCKEVLANIQARSWDSQSDSPWGAKF